MDQIFNLRFQLLENSQFANLHNTEPQPFLSAAIQAVLVIAIIIFFFMLLFGGIKWVSSQGNPQAIDSAKKTVTSAIVGLIIVFSVFVITMFVNAAFSTDIGNLGGGQFTGSSTTPPPGSEICDNSIDDDADGAIDCFDSDCFGHPACP